MHVGERGATDALRLEPRGHGVLARGEGVLDAREHQVALARELGGRRLEAGLAHLSAGEGGGQCESEGLQVEWWVGGGWG